MRRLILGGVRSGKSRLAEQWARASGLPVTYLATAMPGDEEMRLRIEAHRQRRPSHWGLVEEPYRLADMLLRHAGEGRCLIVECLTLWLTNLLLEDDQRRFEHERQALLEVLPKLPGEIILVGNESNMGVVPLGALSRRFCDESGRLYQALAEACDKVYLTVAGLPMRLKGDED
jgi:adenosylcobinamide kinase/adenosylcobinamide-phosphate guanylyltransferase